MSDHPRRTRGSESHETTPAVALAADEAATMSSWSAPWPLQQVQKTSSSTTISRVEQQKRKKQRLQQPPAKASVVKAVSIAKSRSYEKEVDGSCGAPTLPVSPARGDWLETSEKKINKENTAKQPPHDVSTITSMEQNDLAYAASVQQDDDDRIAAFFGSKNVKDKKRDKNNQAGIETQVETPPGAFRIFPSGSRDDEEEDDFPPPRSPPGSPPRSPPGSPPRSPPRYARSEERTVMLTDAHLVESQVFATVTAVLPETNLPSSTESERPHRRKPLVFGLVLVAVAIVAVGVAVGVTSANKKAASSPQDSFPTVAPTLQPTMPLNRTAILAEFRSSLSNETLDALANASSPQAMAYEWVTLSLEDDEETPTVLPLEFLADPVMRMVQRFALATLYYSTNGDESWKKKDGWLNQSGTECSWLGCSCTEEENNRIRSLELDSNGLDGSLPMEIGLLSALDYLMLRENALLGSIPTELGSLSLLDKLYLDNNKLTGPIPSELGTLPNLAIAQLFNNELTGSVPVAFCNLISENELVLTVDCENGCDCGCASCI